MSIRLLTVSGMAALCAVAATVALVLGVYERGSTGARDLLPSAQGHIFNGRTVGPDNEPLRGVMIEAVAAEMGQNATIPGWVPVRDTQRTLTAVTDAEGRFQLQLPHGYQHLEINKVELAGHGWVRDRVWGHTEGRVGHPALYNTSFFLLGGPNVPGTYVSEEDHPAVFPLHPDGDERPAAWPSRGGRDRRVANANVWMFHFPVPALCPTAGGDAASSLTSQQVTDVFVAWREELQASRLEDGWATREEAESYRDKLIAIAQKIIERLKRGDIPSQLDEFRKRSQAPNPVLDGVVATPSTPHPPAPRTTSQAGGGCFETEKGTVRLARGKWGARGGKGGAKGTFIFPDDPVSVRVPLCPALGLGRQSRLPRAQPWQRPGHRLSQGWRLRRLRAADLGRMLAPADARAGGVPDAQPLPPGPLAAGGRGHLALDALPAQRPRPPLPVPLRRKRACRPSPVCTLTLPPAPPAPARRSLPPRAFGSAAERQAMPHPARGGTGS